VDELELAGMGSSLSVRWLEWTDAGSRHYPLPCRPEPMSLTHRPALRSSFFKRKLAFFSAPAIMAGTGPDNHTMTKLILRNFQSPGDLVMLTAVVRDLHACCPGKYRTDVRTSLHPGLLPLLEAETVITQMPTFIPPDPLLSPNRLQATVTPRPRVNPETDSSPWRRAVAVPSINLWSSAQRIEHAHAKSIGL
jgi:hypothetical protein